MTPVTWVLLVLLRTAGGGQEAIEFHLDSLKEPATYCEVAHERLRDRPDVVMSYCWEENKPTTSASR